MKAYKVLQSDMQSPFQKFEYELGKEYHSEDFDTDTKKDCSRGFYATGIEGILYSFKKNYRVFECEVHGQKVEIDQFKCRYEYIKLIRELSYDEVRILASKEEQKLGYKLSEALFPVNPFEMEPAPRDDLEKLLREWVSVRDSVQDSVRGSVWGSVWSSVRDSVWGSVQDSVRGSVQDSVRGSVRGSVWDSVWDSVLDSAWGSVQDSVRGSVRGSVWDSVWDSVLDSAWNSAWDSVWDSAYAYISSLFPGIKKWEGIEHKEGVNPFQACIDLWRSGYVPSFDGEKWRLHAGKNASVALEIDA